LENGASGNSFPTINGTRFKLPVEDEPVFHFCNDTDPAAET
jgi:hypothetical protein